MQYIFQILYLFLISVTTTQIQPFLKNIGFTLIQCGFFYSGSAIVAYLIQYLYQKCRIQISVVSILKIGLLLLMICSFLLDRLIWVWFSSVLLFACAKSLMNLNEIYCFQNKHRYSILRCFASLGMAIGAYVSIDWSFSHHFIYLLLFFLIVIFIPIPNMSSQSTSCFKMNHSDVLFVCMLALLFAIGSADQYIVTAKIISLGGSSYIIGWKMVLQCCSEIPIYYFLNKIFSKFTCQRVLCFAIFMFMIRFALYAWINDVSILIYVSLLQGGTIPLMMSASKYYVLKLHPNQEGTQLKYLSVFTSIALIVAPLLYSALSLLLSLNYILYLCSFLCMIALFLKRLLDKSLK